MSPLFEPKTDRPKTDGPKSDVAPAKASVEALVTRAENAERSLLRFLDTAPEATLIHKNRIIQYVNPALLTLLGYESACELVGSEGTTRIVHPDDMQELIETQRRSDAGEETGPSRTRWLTKTGESVHVESVRTRIEYEGGPAVAVRARDIREAMRAVETQEMTEASLRISEERYKLLFDKNPTPGYVFNPATLEIFAVNESARRLYGYSGEEFLRLKVSDLRIETELPDLVYDVAFVAAQKSDDPTYRGTKTHRKKDGSVIRVAITAHALTLEGRPAVLAMCRDVTDIETMERQLRQAQKMEAVGQLAGGIAHDFNNILAVILAVADMMLSDVGDQHAFASDLREIESAARRAADLTHQLLAFSRQRPGQPKDISLNDVVGELRNIIERTLREDITTSLVLSAKGFVHADPAHLEQVLLNLVVNARDAMPSGGQLVIRTADVEISDVDAAKLGVSPGRFVELAVKDTGDGMDAPTAARVFEPFFTTKEIGKGTGLGLATAFGIVRQAEGAISVQSTRGEGSTFLVVLPRVAPPAIVQASQTTKNHLPRGTEKVLVVEDDESVRVVVSRLLRSQGYIVVEAGNGQEALDRLATEDDIAIVLTDVVMPRMDGRTLGREIAVRSPLTKVIYMSGHEPSDLKSPSLPPAENVLAKPFTLEQILQAVRRGIDSKAQTR